MNQIKHIGSTKIFFTSFYNKQLMALSSKKMPDKTKKATRFWMLPFLLFY